MLRQGKLSPFMSCSAQLRLPVNNILEDWGFGGGCDPGYMHTKRRVSREPMKGPDCALMTWLACVDDSGSTAAGQKAGAT